MRSALLHRAARYAAAPAAAGTASFLGQRGSSGAASRAPPIALNHRGRQRSFSLLPRRHFADAAKAAAPEKAAAGESAKASVGGATKAAADKVAAGGAGTGGGGGFVAWYESHLQSRPVPTKMVTGCFLWGLGDVVAQVVPVVTHPSPPPSEAPSDGAVAPHEPFVFDFPRLARACTFGCVMHAPLAHLHYNFLEWMTVRAGFEGLKIPLFKAFMEQFVYWSWFSNSLYHGAMGAMQGMSVQQCYDRIADVLWDTQKAQWAFWIPVQLVNFQYVPVRHQLNVVLLTSIVWTALLSAWYPPQEEEKKERKELIK